MKSDTTLAKIAITVMLLVLLLALPAAASDYTLGVFGNANEDDTINMQDVTYTELIILEYRDKTELSDAKHDGKINMQDVTQIELVILGKEKEMTVLDSAGRIVTVDKPVERIFSLGCGEVDEAMRVLDAMDKIVGYSREGFSEEKQKKFFPEYDDLPKVSTWPPGDCDYEAVLSLDPDIAIDLAPGSTRYEENLPGVALLYFNFFKDLDQMFYEMKTLGYVLDSEEQAQEYIDFAEGYLSTVSEKIETLAEDEKPIVYIGGLTNIYKTFNETGGPPYSIKMAGGRNMAEGLTGYNPWGAVEVDPEWVIEQNPEIIVLMTGRDLGYAVDDPSSVKDLRTAVLNRAELAHVDAVENEKVYVISSTDILLPPSKIVSIIYFGKWFHPELFEDLDPQEVHQEYLDTFHESLDWDVSEEGVFVYPPFEE